MVHAVHLIIHKKRKPIAKIPSGDVKIIMKINMTLHQLIKRLVYVGARMLGVGRKAIYKMNKWHPFERRGTIFDLVLGSNPNVGQLEIFWHKLVCVFYHYFIYHAPKKESHKSRNARNELKLKQVIRWINLILSAFNSHKQVV